MLRFVYLWDLPEKLFPSLHSETKGRCKKRQSGENFPLHRQASLVWSVGTFEVHFQSIFLPSVISDYHPGGGEEVLRQHQKKGQNATECFPEQVGR